MKRPTEVFVGYAPWRIRWQGPKAWKRGTKLKTLGLAWTNRLEIWLQDDPGVAELVYAEVLLHEILHAAFEAGCLAQALNLARPKDREEIVVAGLSPILLGVLRDNPDLVEYLTEA